MQLFNKTKCPNSILKPLLAIAAESIGVKTAGVVVKVTQGHGNAISGRAMDWCIVYLDHLQRKRRKKFVWNRAAIRVKGYIELVLPKPRRLELYSLTYEGLAHKFYAVAQHEWAHIKDFRNKISGATLQTPSGRRVNWKDRPCEQYAQREVMFATKLWVDNDKPMKDLAKYWKNGVADGPKAEETKV